MAAGEVSATQISSALLVLMGIAIHVVPGRYFQSAPTSATSATRLPDMLPRCDSIGVWRTLDML